MLNIINLWRVYVLISRFISPITRQKNDGERLSLSFILNPTCMDRKDKGAISSSGCLRSLFAKVVEHSIFYILLHDVLEQLLRFLHGLN